MQAPPLKEYIWSPLYVKGGVCFSPNQLSLMSSPLKLIFWLPLLQSFRPLSDPLEACFVLAWAQYQRLPSSPIWNVSHSAFACYLYFFRFIASFGKVIRVWWWVVTVFVEMRSPHFPASWSISSIVTPSPLYFPLWAPTCLTIFAHPFFPPAWPNTNNFGERGLFIADPPRFRVLPPPPLIFPHYRVPPPLKLKGAFSAFPRYETQAVNFDVWWTSEVFFTPPFFSSFSYRSGKEAKIVGPDNLL